MASAPPLPKPPPLPGEPEEPAPPDPVIGKQNVGRLTFFVRSAYKPVRY